MKASIKSKKSTSIKTRLVVSYVLLAAIPLLTVNMISTSGFQKNLRDTSMQLTTQMVKQMNTNIDYFTKDVEKNVNKFISNNLNGNDKSLINNYEQSKNQMEHSKNAQEIRKQLIGISVYEENIESAVVLTDSGEVIGESGILNEEAIKVIREMDLTKEIWYRDINLNKNIFYIRPIKNSITGKNFGVFLSVVKLESLNEEIASIELFEGAKIYVVDEKNNVLCATTEENMETAVQNYISQNEEIASKIIGSRMVAYATGNCGWKIVVELSEKSLTSSISTLNRLVWLLVVIVGILGILIGYYISKSVTGSISALVKAMKKTEQGDLTVQVPVKGKDEMASLCTSFNKMILNVNKVIEQTHSAIDVSLESGDTLSESTKQSVETFEQLAISISEIAKGSTVQAESAQGSLIVMNKLSDSIQDVRENTQSLFENTKNARDTINHATESMELLNGTMKSSIEVSGKIEESISQLGDMTKSIEQIMGFVDGISEQTNLLALNASIEAARAGEVGKGFAVVANEVRNLAEQSKKSTEHVRVTLSNIEKQSESTAELVKKANQIFSNQEEAVNKTYSAFKEIIQMLVHMDKQLERINTQVIDMQMVKESMNDSMEEITTVTEESASATEEVNALSEEQKEVMEKLSRMAVHLVEIMKQLESSIKQFKIQ